jgi:HPt (histidine-containing phosphotransfer) domain-containing protein
MGVEATEDIIELVQIFVDDTETRIERLCQAAEQQNIEEVHRLAHALKSSCSYIGAEELGALCAELEEAGRTEDFLHAAEMTRALPLVFRNLREALQRAGVSCAA